MGVERKLATVLFVDLVDSTGLVSTTDPEIYGEITRRATGAFPVPGAGGGPSA